MSPWEHTLDAVRRRWPKALVRVTMMKPTGDDAFVAAVVQLTRSGPGAEDELLERAADVARRLAAAPPPAPARGGDGPLFARKDDR